MTVKFTVVVAGQIVQGGVPKDAVFVVHFDNRQRRIILVRQPCIWIDMFEKCTLPLPLSILQLSHHSDHAGSALSGSFIRQLIIKVLRIAIVRRDYMRVEQRPGHGDAVVLED